MKVKQNNIKAFDIEIEDEVEFFSYFNKNLPLLQSHLMVLRGNVSQGVKAYLQNKKVAFVDANEVSLATKRAKKIEAEIVVKKVATKESVQPQKEQVDCPKSLLINKTVRSGEIIDNSGDIVVIGRINSGAKIISEQNVQVFGIIEGDVEAQGEYIILEGMGVSAHVSLRNESIDATKCRFNLTLVTIGKTGLEYKEI